MKLYKNIFCKNNKLQKRMHATRTFTLVSDIHLTKKDAAHWKEYISDGTETLVLAGDICQLENMDVIVKFLTELCNESGYKSILYVCGNHEFYNHMGYTMIGLLAQFKYETKHLSKLKILQNETVDIGDHLRVFGTTLWSHIPTRQLTLPIFDEFGDLVTSNWMNREHYTSLTALDKAIQNAGKEGKRLIVVSHYAPSFTGTLLPEHLSNEKKDKNVYYCSNLDHLLYSRVVYTWMYGHTHVNVDLLTPGNTRLVTNQYKGKHFNMHKNIIIRDVVYT